MLNGIIDTCDANCFLKITHAQAASFLRKIGFSLANNVLYLKKQPRSDKCNYIFLKYVKNKGNVGLDTFLDSDDVDSYRGDIMQLFKI